MARRFLSNSRQAEPFLARRRWAALLLVPLLLLSTACATGNAGKTPFEGWPADGEDAVTAYLSGLREYLALPAGEQATHRQRLRVAAETGGPPAELDYAFALSVDRDSRVSLEQARAHFETLLTAPDPLPVALDTLVRLQLGQVIDRLQRMQSGEDFRDAYRAAAEGQRMCFAQLRDSERKLDEMRTQLREVRQKLDALARIEQTVNHGQDAERGSERQDGMARDEQETEEQEDNAERQPDTARR